MDMPRTYQGWLIWRNADCMEWRVMIATWQTLIPLAYHDLLLKGIWDALTKISHFFRDIWLSKLNVDYIERLETNITETICKIEMIFPLFFYSIEHLPIHLPFEAKVGWPVQHRWMYPFERLYIIVAMEFIYKSTFIVFLNWIFLLIPCRYLINVKKKVKNKAHIEASICEAYIVEEISTFI